MLTVHLIMEPNKAHKAFSNVREATFNADYTEFTFNQEYLAGTPNAHSVKNQYQSKDIYMVTVYDGPTVLFQASGGRSYT